jgi:hypothetical protein
MEIEEDNYSYMFDGDGTEGFEGELDDYVEDDSTPVIPKHCTLATMGLCNLEKAGHAFYVTDAYPGSADELGECMGKDNSLVVNFANWDPGRLKHQIDILSEHGTKPVRVIFRNFGKATDGHCTHLQDIIGRKEGYPIKSVWFVKEDEHDVPQSINHKVLLNCMQLDSTTLLDAIAYGWGGKGEEPIPGLPSTNPSALDNTYIDLDRMRTRI